MNENDYCLQQQQPIFNVFLPEDCSDFVVIDEHNDSLDSFTQYFDIQRNSQREPSSINPSPQQSSTNKKCELLNITHDKLTFFSLVL